MRCFLFGLLCFLLLLPSIAIAAYSSGQGVGQVAANILEPVTILSDFVGNASIIIGATSLFAAFLRYMQHRINPLASPISTVIVLLIIGIVLILLPLAYKLTDNGIPYSMLGS